ncbi:MAG: hypothetical protein HFF73_11485 [Oscillospiraceae bacterium]|nr:hypothetical protein [Oscillospiraceae bacterium]
MQNHKRVFQPRTVEEAVDEIDRILHQMLVLAELSAGEGNLDRATLQKTLDHMRREIDRLADQIDLLS